MKTSVIILLIFFTITSCRQTIKQSNLISDDDQADLIKLILEPLILKGDTIITTTPDINVRLIPTIENVNFVVLSEKEIHEQADEEGGFTYLLFGPMKVVCHDPVSIRIDISMEWMASYGTDERPLSLGGYGAVWVKENNIWHYKGGSGWYE